MAGRECIDAVPNWTVLFSANYSVHVKSIPCILSVVIPTRCHIRRRVNKTLLFLGSSCSRPMYVAEKYYRVVDCTHYPASKLVSKIGQDLTHGKKSNIAHMAEFATLSTWIRWPLSQTVVRRRIERCGETVDYSPGIYLHFRTLLRSTPQIKWIRGVYGVRSTKERNATEPGRAQVRMNTLGFCLHTQCILQRRFTLYL